MIKERKIKHEWYQNQAKIFQSKTRFIVACTGRRFGKTRGAIQWIVENSLKKNKSLNWWIAPTYRQAKIAIKYLLRLYPQYKFHLIKHFNKAGLSIEFINGSTIEFKSADTPEHLEGEGLDSLVIDEAGIVLKNENLWYHSLRPMLMDTLGKVCFIGTPKGGGLFKQFFIRGQGGDKDWKSFKFSSLDGHMGRLPQEIEEMKSSVPEYVYKQEVLAEFLEDGSLFRNVEVVCSFNGEASCNREYVAGIDLARHTDYTVIAIGYDNKCVYMERIPHMSWSLQFERIGQILKDWNMPRILIDSTGAGDAFYESLQEGGHRVEGIQFNNINKTNMINNLVLNFEKKTIQVIRNEALIDELKNFEFSILSSGKMKMEAISGRHDDHVIALALLFWGLKDYIVNVKPMLENTGQKRESYKSQATYIKIAKDSMLL